MGQSEKNAHDVFYSKANDLKQEIRDATTYIKWYHTRYLQPFFLGGITKGYVRCLAVNKLLEAVNERGLAKHDVTVLDAGCGQGGLSVYLAALGFQVIGVDLSSVACEDARQLAAQTGVENRCRFIDSSLAELPLPDQSIDFIIGHASLHHFIKYDGIVPEFARVCREKSKGFFADAYGENRIYHLFHNKEQMERLGDVSLTLPMVKDYFEPQFSATMYGTDWFVMLDKLWLKLLPSSMTDWLRKMSRFYFAVDRIIPEHSRLALRCAGSALTVISKHD